MQKISFKLNGEIRYLNVEGHEIFSEVLRDRLGIKSPKIGCNNGDCGTCTILLDGKPVRSCLILAAEIDGHEVLTLEGLGQAGMTPLQKALHEHNAFQCGYCAPGMILSLHSLLETNEHPKKEEIQEAIAGNLCRCTGYQSVIDAVLDLTTKE